MQNANTLYYSVTAQRNRRGLFVVCSFVNPAVSNMLFVAQRTACQVVSTERNATTAEVAAIVARVQQQHKAARLCNYVSSGMTKQLRKNDAARALY